MSWVVPCWRTDRQTDRQTESHDEASSSFSQFWERAYKVSHFQKTISIFEQKRTNSEFLKDLPVMGWADVRCGEGEIRVQFLVPKSEWKRLLGRPRCTWDDIIKKHILKKLDVLAQSGTLWRNLATEYWIVAFHKMRGIYWVAEKLRSAQRAVPMLLSGYDELVPRVKLLWYHPRSLWIEFDYH